MLLTDWLLVILTAIYVVATILISVYNARSSKATREQIKESHAQFIDANRAFVNIDFDIIRDELFVLKITNNGNRTAENVHIVVSDNFRGIICDQGCAKQIEELNHSTFSIGVGQSMFARLGMRAEYNVLCQEPVGITLDYSDIYSSYHETKTIQISQYGWGLVYDSPISDIRTYLKSVSESVKKISSKKSN